MGLGKVDYSSQVLEEEALCTMQDDGKVSVLNRKQKGSKVEARASIGVSAETKTEQSERFRTGWSEQFLQAVAHKRGLFSCLMPGPRMI